ncbi:hypothetical protein ACFE04_003994 [Oxalis oulophora]
MAGSESAHQQDTFGLRKISSSLFRIPSFSFSTKTSDSVTSPTSPLDFKVFANLNNPFSGKAIIPSSQNGNQKNWDSDEVVGLSIVNLLVGDSKPNDKLIDSPKRSNVIFGRQVKTNYEYSLDYPRKSNSLPKNYTISPILQIKTPRSRFSSSKAVVLSEGKLDSQNFCSEILTTSPLAINGGSLVEHPLLVKSSSLPIPISPCEIEHSEDYTCIISHGPNPKTTHIFGDYILDGHVHELASFNGTKKEQDTESPQVSKQNEDSISMVYPSDKFLSFCHACKKNLANEEDIYMYRGEKAFCSLDCRSLEIFAEDTEENCDNSFKGSDESSYHEDLFLMGMPLT